MTRVLRVLVVLAIGLAACAPNETRSSDQTSTDAAATDAAPTVGPSARFPLPPNDLYDPVRAGEPVPGGFRQSLPRDAIFPVYDPRFVGSRDVDWSDDILVIGVDLQDEARAYPVGFLNRREIVIDNHRGIPTLVTW